MKSFKFHCSAGLLVDDGVMKWEVEAPTVADAWNKATEFLQKCSVLDSGSLDIRMDIHDLATELGNIACEDEEPWDPTELEEELRSVIHCEELIDTLESIVSNYNK